MTTISVFCPTPLLTVTIESSLDGAPELHIHAGGQGFWVARMVARLGVPVTLCAPLGGDTGRLLKELMAQENVTLRTVAIGGVTGSYVHDRRTGERVEICRVEGSRLTRHEYDDLFNATFAAAMDSKLLVLTGQFPSPVVPAAMFKRLARDLRANGRLVVADLTGEDLEEALAGGLDALCFSDEEMVQQGLTKSEDLQQLTAGMESIAKRGDRKSVV